MKERPILFQSEMVRALLDGRKTQTRRDRYLKNINESPDYRLTWQGISGGVFGVRFDRPRKTIFIPSPYGAPGDHLWVRETFCIGHFNEIIYRATEPDQGCSHPEDMSPWKPSIFMPRRESRITLEITSVRVERLQDISAADAASEGRPICDQCGDCGWINSGPDGGRQCDARNCGTSDIEWYAALWDSINGSGSWKANPDVVVLQFSVHLCNIDRMPTDG